MARARARGRTLREHSLEVVMMMIEVDIARTRASRRVRPTDQTRRDRPTDQRRCDRPTDQIRRDQT